ncbi:MAG TPA: MarR family transcriptional regulator [Candidatus Mediterraneibacter pullicola]|uniref:MarR family transcriptional regulator n=1 Tax=Candidatus Mediterraneibacter pullicola TaxID=2838682 RepID=A0A9D2KIG3_9FIRM|nr:MarR family transcriptional regulator [Candidatus Mediterraneibacter pullicola]
MFRCDMSDIPILGLLGIVSHRAKNTAMSMYREFDMNRSSAGVLFLLYQRKTMSQKALAEQLNVTAPSITSLIQKMEKTGYITRRPDDQDQRVMRLSLTEKGKSCIQSVKDVAERMEKIIFEGMSVEERLLFRRLMLQVNENLDNYERKERA